MHRIAPTNHLSPLLHYYILLIDNGSTDGSEEILRKRFPELTFIQTGRNLGFAGGMNVGIRHALKTGTDHMVLLNNDTIVAPDFIEALVKVAQTDRRIGLLSSKIYFHETPDRIWYAGASFHPWLGLGLHRGYDVRDEGQFDRVEETPRACACSMLVTRELCEKVGLLNEEYFCYCEEMDWGLRARKAGFKIMFVPDSRVWHKFARSTQGSQTLLFHYYQVRNTLRCLDLNHPLPLFLHLFRCFALAAGSVFILFPRKFPKILGLKRIYQGFRDYFQGRFGEFRG